MQGQSLLNYCFNLMLSPKNGDVYILNQLYDSKFHVKK